MPLPNIHTGISAVATDTRQSAHERYRMRWDECMGHPSKAVNHKSAAVLLLSWDRRHDDLDVQDEVGAGATDKR